MSTSLPGGANSKNNAYQPGFQTGQAAHIQQQANGQQPSMQSSDSMLPSSKVSQVLCNFFVAERIFA